jgi:anti-sigma factor ChrR (cupin superfamily)
MEQVHAYALDALTPAHAAEVEAHLASCVECREQFESIRPVLDALHTWSTDVLRPTASLQLRLAHRIAADTASEPVLPATRQWSEPTWRQVAPGIECKLLSKDPRTSLVSMLVRLAAGAEYPPHIHANVEELHLLDGELWIDDRKLYPGDYNRAEPGTGDKRVWSETGCTCVLITSTLDTLL